MHTKAALVVSLFLSSFLILGSCTSSPSKSNSNENGVSSNAESNGQPSSNPLEINGRDYREGSSFKGVCDFEYQSSDDRFAYYVVKIEEAKEAYLSTLGTAEMNTGATTLTVSTCNATSTTIKNSISVEIAMSLKVTSTIGDDFSSVSTECGFSSKLTRTVEEAITGSYSITQSYSEKLPKSNIGYYYRFAVIGNFNTYEYVKISKATGEATISYFYGLTSDLAICLQYCQALSFDYDSAFYSSFNTKTYTTDQVVSLALGGGLGTEDVPYQLSQAQQLTCIPAIGLDKHYILMNDLDLSKYHNWEPIGGCYREREFTGSLDGKGYSIKNFSRSLDIEEKNNRSFFGLFGKVGTAGIIKNISFKDVTVRITGPAKDNGSMRAFFGTVAGTNCGVIENVNVSGSLTYDCCTNGESWVGGICGYLNKGTIKGCENSMDIKSARYTGLAGGIAAMGNGGLIQNCSNSGNIVSYGTDWGGCSFASGILASCNKTSRTSLSNCKNSGKISATKYDDSSWFTNCNIKSSNNGIADPDNPNTY